jgi:hypothetical protein
MITKWTIFVFQLLLFFFLLGCSNNENSITLPIIEAAPTSTIMEIENVRVDNPEFPEKRIVGNPENIELPNCFGSANLTRTLGTQTTITSTLNMGTTAKVTGGGEVDIPATAKLKLEVEIGKAYAETKQSATSRLDTAEMTAAPGTYIIYVIEWKEIEYKSIVLFASGNDVYTADYSYKLIVPDITANSSKVCPADISLVPTNTPISQTQPPAIIHYPTDVELNNTLNIWDFVDEEDLYSPGAKTYSLAISAQQNYRWGAIWCGKNGSYLQQIMAPLDMQLWIDNIRVPNEKISQYDTVEFGVYCHRWTTIISGWPTDRATMLELRYFVAYPVSDGWTTVNPGEYKQVISAIAP